VLVATFMVVEVVGGLVSGSLALLADAGHMLTDALALALSYAAVWLAGRETSHTRTYGFRRAELLAAFVNALLLMLLAIWIVVAALERLNQPRPVLTGVLLWVALGGLAVNLAAWALLHSHARTHIGVRSALWHVMGDVLGSVGAIVAALVIRFTGWTAIDPLIGIGIAMLIGLGSARILYDSTHLLLDSVPRGIDSMAVREFLSACSNVTQICDLHIWAVSSTETMLTAHLVVSDDTDRDLFLHGLLEELKSRFGLAHMTVQLESTPMDSCEPGW
jgi:cobalt-zinc-cadmium efflux system protein